MVDERQRGTIVAIQHKGRPYYHYGVLDGNNGVVHIVKKRNMVSVDPLDRVLRNAIRIEVIDEDDETRNRNWERVSQQIDAYYDYSILSNNCEGWINSIRRGDSSSYQVDKYIQLGVIASLFLL